MVIDHAEASDPGFDYCQEGELEAVQHIVEKIAKDPPTTVIIHWMNSFVKVQGQQRPKDMHFNSFMSKFMAYSQHLIHSNSTAGAPSRRIPSVHPFEQWQSREGNVSR